MKPSELAQDDERYVMGQWFESVAAAVKAYPMRAGTQAGKVIEYDRAIVSVLSREFNKTSRSRDIPSGLEQASAGKHVYNVDKKTGWTETDAKGIDVAAQDYQSGLEKVDGPTFATKFMLERMKRLYKICKLNRIGVVVHTPQPGCIQIDLTPQERPIHKPVLRPQKMRFGG
jgi:hypothetical protein